MGPEEASGIAVNAGNARASMVKQGDGFSVVLLLFVEAGSYYVA